MELAILLLRAIGILLFLSFGIFQSKELKQWTEAIPQAIRNVLPGNHQVYMQVHASINILLGLWFVLGFWLQLAALVAAIWMLGIVIMLIFDLKANKDIIVRDTCLALAFFALFFLCAIISPHYDWKT